MREPLSRHGAASSLILLGAAQGWFLPRLLLGGGAAFRNAKFSCFVVTSTNCGPSSSSFLRGMRQSARSKPFGRGQRLLQRTLILVRRSVKIKAIEWANGKWMSWWR